MEAVKLNFPVEVPIAQLDTGQLFCSDIYDQDVWIITDAPHGPGRVTCVAWEGKKAGLSMEFDWTEKVHPVHRNPVVKVATE